MNMVHESFLRWLHHQRNHERLANYDTYNSYYNGDHDVDIPPKVQAALESELGTVMNYCRLVVDATVDYIAGGEIGIEAPDNPEAEAALYEVYEENELLSLEMFKLLTVLGKKGDIFLKLYLEDSEIKIAVLRPDICFPRYETDNYKVMKYCAVQWFEDVDDFSNDEGGVWKAQVYRKDVVDYYTLRGNIDSEMTEWELTGSEKNILGFIPIIHIKNTIDDLEFGVSDIQIMSDLQDALNKTITDMLLTMDNQAFQRMWIFGAQTPKGHELSMEPGMITEVPTAEGHLDIVQPATIEPFINALDKIVDHIMTVTQLSKITIMKPDAPLAPSGFALRIHMIPQERKADKKVSVLTSCFKKLNKMIFEAMKTLGKTDYTGTKTRLHFTGGLPIDEQMQMQIDEMEIRNKVRSRKTIMEQRGVEDVVAEQALIDQETDDALNQELDYETRKAKALAPLQIRGPVKS